MNMRWISQTRIALIVLALVTLVGAQPSISQYFAFQAQWFSDSEWWRPFTAWLTQLNMNHWLLNQWGVVLMAVLLPAKLSKMEWLGYVVIWLLSSFALAFSDYTNYMGLSGVLYGWLVWSTFLTPFYANWIKLIFIGGLSAKVFSENGLFELPQSDWVAHFIQANVAHESHLWGLVSGLAMILLSLLARKPLLSIQ